MLAGSVHVQVTLLSPIPKLSPDWGEQDITTSVPELSVQDAAKVAAISLVSDGAVRPISAGHVTAGLVSSVLVRNVRQFKKSIFLDIHSWIPHECLFLVVRQNHLLFLRALSGQWNTEKT